MWVRPQTALWKAPPIPPLQLEGPFPQAAALPSPPSGSLFPHPPGSFCNAPGRGGPGRCGGWGPMAQKGGGGEGPSKRHLGPDPHQGVLDFCTTTNCTGRAQRKWVQPCVLHFLGSSSEAALMLVSGHASKRVA